MTIFIEMTQEFVKTALKRANFAILNEDQNDRVEVVQIQTTQGNSHNLFIQEIDLDNQRSVKIQKTDLGELNRDR